MLPTERTQTPVSFSESDTEPLNSQYERIQEIFTETQQQSHSTTNNPVKLKHAAVQQTQEEAAVEDIAKAMLNLKLRPLNISAGSELSKTQSSGAESQVTNHENTQQQEKNNPMPLKPTLPQTDENTQQQGAAKPKKNQQEKSEKSEYDEDELIRSQKKVEEQATNLASARITKENARAQKQYDEICSSSLENADDLLNRVGALKLQVQALKGQFKKNPEIFTADTAKIMVQDLVKTYNELIERGLSFKEDLKKHISILEVFIKNPHEKTRQSVVRVASYHTPTQQKMENSLTDTIAKNKALYRELLSGLEKKWELVQTTLTKLQPEISRLMDYKDGQFPFKFPYRWGLNFSWLGYEEHVKSPSVLNLDM